MIPRKGCPEVPVTSEVQLKPVRFSFRVSRADQPGNIALISGSQHCEEMIFCCFEFLGLWYSGTTAREYEQRAVNQRCWAEPVLTSVALHTAPSLVQCLMRVTGSQQSFASTSCFFGRSREKNPQHYSFEGEMDHGKIQDLCSLQTRSEKSLSLDNVGGRVSPPLPQD